MDQLRTPPQPPSNNAQHHPPSKTGTRTVSMTSCTMEDWDLPNTNFPINPITIAPETVTIENSDDDFAVKTRNNLPRMADLFSLRRVLAAFTFQLQLFISFKDEDRAVTARSRHGAHFRLACSNSSPPPPVALFSNQHPSREPFPVHRTASTPTGSFDTR